MKTENASATAPKPTTAKQEMKVLKKEDGNVAEQAKALIEELKPKPTTAESRISKLKEFEALTNRFKLIKEKHSQVKLFEAGNDRTNAKIVFQNSLGFEFDIRNSGVIEKMKDLALKELQTLHDEAEEAILSFEI